MEGECVVTFEGEEIGEEESTASSTEYNTPTRHISKLPSLDSNSSFLDFHRPSLDSEAKIRLLELQVHELQQELKRATQSLCTTPALSPKSNKYKRKSEGDNFIPSSSVLFQVEENEETDDMTHPGLHSKARSMYLTSPNPDISYQIPTITYESDSSSDEDSFSLSLQRKYCAN